MQLRWPHWCCALGTATALHLGAFAVLAHSPRPTPGGEIPLALNLALGTGGSPGMASVAASASEEVLDPVAPKDQAASEPVVAEAAAVEPAATRATDPLQADMTTPAAEVAAAPPDRVPETDAVQDLAAVVPVEMVVAKSAPLTVATSRPSPPVPTPRPRAVKAASAPAPEEVAPVPVKQVSLQAVARELPEGSGPPAVEAQSSSPEGISEAKADRQVAVSSAASSASSGGGGNAGRNDREAGNAGSANYMLLLQAWLEKHKRYPRRARLHRQEGTTLLHFVMDRNGQVLDYRIERSSGHGALDREVVAMIERAKPLPKIPSDIGREKLELIIPVQFILH